MYFSPKSSLSYSSQNTNPLFEKETKGYSDTMLPLKVVYDHQYGRWYLVGFHRQRGLLKLRMEGLTQIEGDTQVEAAYFKEKQDLLAEKMKHSWLIDTGEPVRVIVKFYPPAGAGPVPTLSRIVYCCRVNGAVSRKSMRDISSMKSSLTALQKSGPGSAASAQAVKCLNRKFCAGR